MPENPFPAEETPAVAEPEPAVPDADNLFSDPAPSVDPFDAPLDETPADSPFDAPANDPFGGAPDAPAVAPEADAFETPAADPFDAPLDDPFGAAPVDSAPAVEPAGEDVFDSPAADPFGAPAADAPVTEDVFDLPADAPVETDPFGAPAADQPDTGGDVFGGALGEPDADDVFNTPAGAADDDIFAAPDEEDLFGKPTSTDAVDLDALFGNPTPAADADEPSEEEISDPLRELFRSTDLRTWRDNTGTFEVQGRLAEIHPDRIRLLKDNGKYCTVPMRRLSESDQMIVQQIASNSQERVVKFISTAN